LSYALDKKLPEAEQTLREAAAQPTADRRVRDNLALVLALEGKFAEAQQVNERDMSPEAAAANVAAVRQMIAQSNSWREIQAADMKKRARPNQKLTDPVAPVELGPQG
jgi:Flp pilus assembly protein TadD